MKNISAIALTCAALGLSVSARATEFIANGDFTQLSNGVGEISDDQYATTVATGWTGNGGYNFVMAQADVGASGLQYSTLSLWDSVNKEGGDVNGWDGKAALSGNFVAADGAFETQPVTQTVTGLTSGKKYTLSFYWAGAQQDGFTGPTTENFTYGLGGDTVTTATLNNDNHGFTGWQHVTHTFTASSGSELLSFLAHGTPNGLPPFSALSNVSLTGAVPEPAHLVDDAGWHRRALGPSRAGVA